MPNSVYHRTHDTLAHFISGRVATRVLEQGLDRAGATADTVSIDAMRDVLMTSVIDDLDDVLPRSGMERTFRALLDDLERAQRPTPSTATPPPDPAALEHRDILATEPGLGETAGALAVWHGAARPGVSDVVPDAAPASDVGAADATADPTPDGVAHAVGAAANATTAAPEAELATGAVPETPAETPDETPAEPSLDPDVSASPGVPEPSPESAGGHETHPSDDASEVRPAVSTHRPAASVDLASALVRFAEIENVSFVATARDDGHLVDARGDGIDAVALARRSASCLRLMERRGHVTTFTLQTGDAILVLAPFGDDLVIVVGTPQLNLGAVFAARSALEEES